jgi:hypothetical protein
VTAVAPARHRGVLKEVAMRLKTAALLPILTLMLAGCSLLFEFNAFSSLDASPAPNAADYEGLGGLGKLATDLGSPAFVDKLAADPETRDAIAEYLLDEYLSAGVTTADQQEAAVLYCDLYLKTTAGEGFVTNVATTLVNGVSSTTTIVELLQATIPPEALADPDAFNDMVDALRTANTQYLALGAGIVDRNGNSVIDKGEGVPSDINMGDVVQKAGVAYTMEVMYQAVHQALPALDDAQIKAQLYLLATDPTKADPAVQELTPNPFDTTSSDPYVAANLPTVEKLFHCAGLELPGSTAS